MEHARTTWNKSKQAKNNPEQHRTNKEQPSSLSPLSPPELGWTFLKILSWDLVGPQVISP